MRGWHFLAGTSSASPIVTGVVVALLSAADTQLDPAAAAAFDAVTIRTSIEGAGSEDAVVRYQAHPAVTWISRLALDLAQQARRAIHLAQHLNDGLWVHAHTAFHALAVEELSASSCHIRACYGWPYTGVGEKIAFDDRT